MLAEDNICGARDLKLLGRTTHGGELTRVYPSEASNSSSQNECSVLTTICPSGDPSLQSGMQCLLGPK